jgi:hypothetical protein
MASSLLLLGAGKGAVTGNLPPTLDSIADPASVAANAGAQTVSLAGITAGGAESQTLTVTATSSDTAVIPNPTVGYTSANTTGTLTYTPAAAGTATVTVQVIDSSSGVVGRTFAVVITEAEEPAFTYADTFAGMNGADVNGRTMTTGGKVWAGTAAFAGNGVEILNDKAQLDASTGNGNYYETAGGMIGDGYYTLDCTTLPDTDQYSVGIFARTLTDGTFDLTGYAATVASDGENCAVRLHWMEDNGDSNFDLDAPHEIGTAAITGNGATVTLKLVMLGTSLKVYVNDVLKIDATDSHYNNTRTGGGIVWHNESGALSGPIVVDNFGAV